MVKSFIARCISMALLVFFLGITTVDAVNFVDYTPGTLGSYWTHQNVDAPGDTYTVSIFEKFLFAGNPAVKMGVDGNNYVICYNDGASVTLYGYVDEGVLYESPVVIGEVTDGEFFNFAQPSNFILMRMWDNLDPTLKSAYNIDSSLSNLVLWATYDSDFLSNSQNSIVESNLAAPIPDYAVTDLTWYKPGVGEIINLDVNAQDGVLRARYELIDYNIVPEPLSVFLMSAGLLGMGGFKKKKKKHVDIE